jgi:hypothetical protein
MNPHIYKDTKGSNRQVRERNALMNHAILRSRMLVLVAGVALALGVAFVLARTSAADSPDSFSDSFVAEGYCAFPVLVESTGHGKLKQLPGGDFLSTGRAVTTFTNVDNPENQLVDPGGGSGRITSLTDAGLEGDVLVVARGHNSLFDPGVGIFLIVGQATFTVAGGPFVGGDINILETHGRVINVCESLA